MKILGIDLTPEETQVLMDEIDEDKSGEISFEEFAKYILEFKEEEEEEHHGHK
jgi:Ca2+-binding EF-hand superfamily protein